MIAIIESNCIGAFGTKFAFRSFQTHFQEDPPRVLFDSRWHKLHATEYRSLIDGRPVERYHLELPGDSGMEARVVFADDSGTPLDRLPR